MVMVTIPAGLWGLAPLQCSTAPPETGGQAWTSASGHKRRWPSHVATSVTSGMPSSRRIVNAGRHAAHAAVGSHLAAKSSQGC
jgi:hypothetical protein